MGKTEDDVDEEEIEKDEEEIEKLIALAKTGDDVWKDLIPSSCDAYIAVNKWILLKERMVIDKWTLLHYVAFKGYVDVAKVLIQNGTDVNAVDKWKRTALLIAAYYGHVDVTKVLLQNGADVNAVNVDKQTALHVAGMNTNSEKLAKVLIQNGADVNAVGWYKWTALHKAADEGHADVAKVLIQNGASVNALNKIRWTALRIAAEKGHNSVVKTLIRNGAKHRYDDILRMSKHLRSLHRLGDRNCRVFTQGEREFLYNFAFVSAIKFPGMGGKLFYSVFHFMSHDGCIMTRIFRISGRRKGKQCLIS